MDTSPSSQSQLVDLQKSFGTNWTKENMTTIFEWLTIASFNIICLDIATKQYKATIRNSIILGMVFSTISGTLSVSDLVVKIGFPDSSLPILRYVFNSFFIAMTFAIAYCTGYIKVYQVQENLEYAIRLKQEWTAFSTAIASELQLPIQLRKDAIWIIVKNKMKYLDLLKSEMEISNKTRENARTQIAKQNVLNIDVHDLSNIIMEIGSVEYKNIVSNRYGSVVKVIAPSNEKLASMETKALQDRSPPRKEEEKPLANPEVNTVAILVR
jgi:hypothetical protein